MTRHRGAGLRAVVLRKGGKACCRRTCRARAPRSRLQPAARPCARARRGNRATSPFDTIRSELTNVKAAACADVCSSAPPFSANDSQIPSSSVNSQKELRARRSIGASAWHSPCSDPQSCPGAAEWLTDHDGDDGELQPADDSSCDADCYPHQRKPERQHYVQGEGCLRQPVVVRSNGGNRGRGWPSARWTARSSQVAARRWPRRGDRHRKRT